MTRNDIIKGIFATTNRTDLDKISEALKIQYGALQVQAARQFVIGDEVNFIAKKALVFGKVAKINQKTVKVVTPEGKAWRVSPSLLSKVA